MTRQAILLKVLENGKRFGRPLRDTVKGMVEHGYSDAEIIAAIRIGRPELTLAMVQKELSK